MLLIKKRSSKRDMDRPLDIELFQHNPGPTQRAYPCSVQDDPYFRLCEAAEKNENLLNVIESLRQGELSRAAGREFLNMDGPLYHDTRAQSIVAAAQTAIAGATTAKMLHPASFTNVPAMYFAVVKKVRQTLAVSVTHGAAVGNVTPTIYFGSSDAGTTLLATGQAQAGVNAGVGPYILQAVGHSRGGALASAVPMVAWGTLLASAAVILQASALPVIPAGAIAPVNIDATTALGFTIQCANSGANGSSYVTHDIVFEALN